jgi:hypothetical protein
VQVDGKPAGDPPVSDLPLAVGAHRLLLVDAQSGDVVREQTFQVLAGHNEPLILDLSEP